MFKVTVVLAVFATVANAGVIQPASVAYGHGVVTGAAPVAYSGGLVAGHAPLAYAAAPAIAKVHAAPVAYAAAPVAYAAAPAVVAKTVIAEDFDPNPQYNYGYSVHDALTGDSKGHQETRNGGVVQGQYSVAEPDGAIRTVTYTADPVNGFNAVVDRSAPAVAVAPVAKVHAAPVAYAAAPAIAKVHAAPIAYGAAPIAYGAAPIAYGAAPIAYGAAPVAYGAGPAIVKTHF